MDNLIISLEATCDLTPELIRKYDLRVISMNFMIDGQEYSTETDSIESSELYSNMRKGKKTSTSQINETRYVEFFEELLSEGKDVLHIVFSSGLSSTYNSAKKAVEEVNKNHTNKVYLVDSLCGSCGQGLVGILAREYSKEADSVEEVVKYVETIRYRIQQWFSADNLKYLANGGRIKASTAFVGNLLNIKPIMSTDDMGKLVSSGKVISRKKALIALSDKLNSLYDKQFDMCFVSHADCAEDAEFVANLIKEHIVLKPYVTSIGPVMGSHCGPGTIAIFFVGQTVR